MNILHLSDLHFGTQTNAMNWYSQLADDLKYELACNSLDLLILSGDIANESTPQEYSAATEFLASLSQEFLLGPDQIVIVPGNHDLNWALAKNAYSLRRRGEYKGPVDETGKPDPSYSIDKGEFVETQNPNKYKQRFSHFSKFYEAIKGKPYPLEYEKQGIIYHYPQYHLLILGLNSAWQLDHYYKARAGINTQALSNALTEIRNHPEVYGQCLKMAVWHHPLSSSDEDRIKDSSFLQRLCQSGFFVALHGHIHKSERNLFRYDISIDGRKLEILSAGTFGAPIREWVPGYPLQYNLIRFRDNNLVIETRVRKELNGTWRPDAIWIQGPSKDPLPRYEITLPKDTTVTSKEQIAPIDILSLKKHTTLATFVLHQYLISRGQVRIHASDASQLLSKEMKIADANASILIKTLLDMRLLKKVAGQQLEVTDTGLYSATQGK